jgi:hypothetical protein
MARGSVPYDPTNFGERPEGGIGVHQNIRATPDEFGGGVARATERFGAQAEQVGQQIGAVGQVFDQIATDDAFNGAQARINKIVHGDPNETGPDGAPNLGYFGSKGRAALDQRKDVETQIDDVLKESRAGLSGQMAQAHFDKMARGYRLSLSERIASHADHQSTVYGIDVNKSTADLALAHIATNADNLDEIAHGTSDLTAAYVKDAELRGGGDEMIDAAMMRARRDALKAWTQSVAVKDPARALDILDKHKESAGAAYDELAQSFRSRVGQQVGMSVGSGALVKSQSGNGWANPATPVFTQATQAVQGGYSSAKGLARVVQIESAGKPDAGAGRSHVGLGQFSEETARLVGIADRHDPAQSIFGIQRYAALNRPALVKVLNREPTDGELYLAHQQGPAGAAALFRQPDVPAVVALAPVYHGNQAAAAAAIKNNGGDPNAPARDFTSMWVKKFGQNVTPTAVPAPSADGVAPPAWMGRGEIVGQPEPTHPETVPTHQESVLTQAYREAMDPMSYPENVRNDPVLFSQAQQHALSMIHQTYTAQQVAEAAEEKQKKKVNDEVAGQFIEKIINGDKNPNIVNTIAGDARLEWRTRNELINIATHHIGNSDEQATVTYGAGFWKAYKQITAPAEDPERVSDIQALLPRAGPGGDLTLAGVQKLSQVMGEMRKSVNDSNVHMALQGQIKSAESKLSFDQEMLFPGAPPLKDEKGRQVFNNQFLSQYLSSYESWVRAGKDPWEFIRNEKNVDDLVNRLRPRSQMAKERMAAVVGAKPDGQRASLDPPPNVKEDAWTQAIAQPPGEFTKYAWAGALRMLLAAPTAETVKAFNDSKFGVKAGQDGAKLIEILTGQAIAPAPEAPQAPAQETTPAAAPGWAPPQELQDNAAKEAKAKEEHDRLPSWQVSGLAPWEPR